MPIAAFHRSTLMKKERRQTCRYELHLESTVMVVNNGRHYERQVLLRDLSQQGALLASDAPLPQDAGLVLSLAGAPTPGVVVRVCEQRVGRFKRLGFYQSHYLIGVQFDEPLSTELFTRLAFPKTSFLRRKETGVDYFDDENIK